MQAIRVHQFGDVDVLSMDQVPVPEPGPGEARVKLEAAGVNYIDIYHRTGQYKGALPLTLGQEGAGVVDAVGPNVTEGCRDRVYASQQGYTRGSDRPLWRLALSHCHQHPASGSGDAAGRRRIIFAQHYPLRPGDTALNHAAASGVGLLLCRLPSRGARVLGTVSTEERRSWRGTARTVILYGPTLRLRSSA
jgi:NADPH2:quinone reductase